MLLYFSLYVPDLSIELDRARSIQKPLTIVFLGRVGRGKSTLVNSLFGKAVVMEGDSVYPVSQEVLINTHHMSGINIIMIDTPGFIATSETPKSTAETMKEIAEKIPAYDVDLIVYCIKMTDRFDGIDEKIASELTRTYGEKLWTHSLFALTFANEVRPSRNCESLSTVTHFKKRLGEMTDAIHKRMLQKSAQVSEIIADNVPVVPAGRPGRLRVGSIIDELPDGSNWMSNFWCQVLHRIHDPIKASCNLHPFIKANDHRFLEQTILT